MTAVMQAVCNGGSEEFSRLINMGGEDLNKADAKGHTALHKACERCKLKELGLLIERGASVNHPTIVSDPPLHDPMNG